MEEFLHWIKDREGDLHGRDDCWNLMGSGIREPLADLLALFAEQQDAIQASLARPNPWGHPALVERLRRRYSVPEDRGLLITGGATAAMWLVCYGLLSPGDRAIVETPIYEPLRAIPVRLGAALDVVSRRPETGYRIDPDELAARVTPTTRLVLLTNLHNPSSACLGDDALARIAHAVQRRNKAVKLVVDETFHDFVMDRQGSVARLGPAFIAINTLTKVYGLGLLRCGWVVADQQVIDKLRVAWVDVAGIGSRLTEALAAVILDRIDHFEAHWKRVLACNRAVLREGVAPLFAEGLIEGDVPTDGCVWFPRIAAGLDGNRLAADLVTRHKVHVVPGRFFGEPGHIRVGFGGDTDRLAEGVRRLVEGIREAATVSRSVPGDTLPR